MSISSACLVEFIKHVMPSIANGEIYGVPGLRAHTDKGSVVLSRPGVPAKIRLWVRPSDWRKSTAIALEESRLEYGGDGPLCPNDWHPAETTFVDNWPDKYGLVWSRDHVAEKGLDEMMLGL